MRGSLRHVLVFAGDLRLGGAEKQLLAVTAALLEAGTAVTLCVYERGHHYDAALLATGARLVDGPRRTDPVSRVVHAVRLARRERPDLVLSWRFYLNPHASFAARAAGVAAIGAVREDLEDAFEGVGRFAPVCLRMPTAILTNSHRSCDALLARGARGIYLANVLDVGAFDRMALTADPVSVPRPEPGEDRPRIIAVGTLKPEKRFDVLLEAYSLLLESRRASGTAAVLPTLSIAGDGELASELRDRARTLGLGAPDLEFLGTRHDIPSLLRRSDIFVLASDKEGTPNAVLEAMAAGLPIVATDAGDTARLITDGVSGRIVSPGDPAALSRAINQLLDDPRAAEELGATARSYVARTCTTAGLAERIFSALEPIIEERGRRVRHRWRR